VAVDGEGLGGAAPFRRGAAGTLAADVDGVTDERVGFRIAGDGLPLAPTVVQAPPVVGTVGVT
jgi:hypothetical protein